MAARLKDTGRSSSVHLVAPRAFARVLSVVENPPKASNELKEFVARARALRNR